VALGENKQVFWWGSNATLEMVNTPVDLNLGSKIPDMNSEYYPVRVMTAWSKTLNVTYLNIADCRASDVQSALKHKVLASLIGKYEEQYALNDSKLNTVLLTY
jgi:hypothetical protein